MIKNSLSLFVLAILTSCQLQSPYQGPLTPTPDQWKGSYTNPDTGVPVISPTWSEEEGQKENLPPKEPTFEEICQDLDNWWEIFEDPILNELEEQALNSSYTLWAALERVIEARATARLNFAPLMPNVTLAPSFSRVGSLVQNPLTGIGSGSSGNGLESSSYCAPPPSPFDIAAAKAVANASQNAPRSFRFIQSQYLIPMNFSYEIDLWYQLHNAYDAAFYRAQAVSQAYLSVFLSLTSDVAAAYFQVRALDTQKEVLRRNILVRQHAVDINRSRFNAGLIVYVDVSRAEVELARAKSDEDDVNRLRGLQENILATLVGVPASVFCLEYNPIFVPPPVIPTGIPSELLCRRPDIAEAERNLAASYKDIGVAYANFFPSLSLNAALGVESPFPHKLFSWQSRYWAVGMNILQSVFDGGRNQANLDYYRARFQESMANYQEHVLQAFKDVEDSLVNLRWYAVQAQDLSDAVKAAQTTLQLSQMRYARGLVNYLDVVDAERELLQTEQNSVIVLGDRYVSTVMLIKALGGGWGQNECSDDDEETCQ